MSEAASKKQTTTVPNTELTHGLWFHTIETGAETPFPWMTDPGVLKHTSWKIPEKKCLQSDTIPQSRLENSVEGRRKNVMGIGWEWEKGTDEY